MWHVAGGDPSTRIAPCHRKPETLRLHFLGSVHCTLHTFVFPRCGPRSTALAAVERRRCTSKRRQSKRGKDSGKEVARLGGSRAANLETFFSPWLSCGGESVVELHSVCQRSRSIGLFAVGLRSHRPCSSVGDGESPRGCCSLTVRSSRSSGRTGWPTISFVKGGCCCAIAISLAPWLQHFLLRTEAARTKRERSRQPII